MPIINGVRVKGITFDKRNNTWIARTSGRKNTTLISGVDFFTALCARKSWEATGRIPDRRREHHNERYTRLYITWVNMKKRCYEENNPRYKDYGGRGITVCEEWKNSYIAFSTWAKENGYSDELQLDRIDTNGNYTPENCRFVTIFVQNQNKRRAKNNTSGLTGVTYCKFHKKWRAYFQENNELLLSKYVEDFFEACCLRKSFEAKYNRRCYNG